MAAINPGERSFSRPGFRAAIFFLVVLLRVTHDRLKEGLLVVCK